NPSSMMVAETTRGSMDFSKALIAGLCSIGGIHAPLIETWNVLMGAWDVDAILKNGGIVPGWGSSFDGKEWEPLDACLALHWPDLYKRIEEVTAKLKKAGRDIKPNPSCWTAAVGIALNLPLVILPWIFVTGRLDAWSIIILNVTAKQMEPQKKPEPERPKLDAATEAGRNYEAMFINPKGN